MKKLFLAATCLLAMVSLAWSGPLVTLEWTANSESDLAGYSVYRSQTDGGPYTKIGSVMAPTVTFTDGTSDYDVLYYYVATAFDTSGNESGYSNQVSNLVEQPDETPPGDPKGVSVTVQVTVN